MPNRAFAGWSHPPRIVYGARPTTQAGGKAWDYFSIRYETAVFLLWYDPSLRGWRAEGSHRADSPLSWRSLVKSYDLSHHLQALLENQKRYQAKKKRPMSLEEEYFQRAGFE